MKTSWKAIRKYYPREITKMIDGMFAEAASAKNRAEAKPKRIKKKNR